jgi:glycogen phosphorylase
MSSVTAYFSAEFGLTEDLPIYSGGLGVLAGDHVKAAADLNLPLVGVGILYRHGYFEQHIRGDGTQEHRYPSIDLSQAPVEPVLAQDGDPLLIDVPIAGRRVALRAWSVRVAAVTVYLLSSDVERNCEADRRLTDNLYPSDPELRICQEIILGIGGARLLEALAVDPAVWHMNEGHSAFLGWERIRRLSAEGVPYDTALGIVKSSTVFTTHTPVPAGHDVFPIEMIDRCLGDFYWQMGASREQAVALGRIGDVFNMTRLAVRLSSRVNGVGKLHAQVTKELFHQWTPHIPKEDIAVESITNGVHAGTWIASDMQQLYDRYLPYGWNGRAADADAWAAVRDIPAQELWDARTRAKDKMVWRLGLPIPAADRTLCIGFARRFATYKRALLLFRDLDRLDRIVNDPERPVCLIFAGKAHPADEPGQAVLRELAAIARQERFKARIFLVENYDMRIAKPLVQGVDVWLNTPQKPMEASGTSGQKAALNGVLNCSVLDGWWAEGYDGTNGWAIEGATDGDAESRDRRDGEHLYALLEQEIVPLYYDVDAGGLPARWIDKVRACIRTLAPRYNTQRMVSEYWHKLYEPTAERAARHAADGYAIADRLAAFRRFISDHWHQVRVNKLAVQSMQSTRIGLNDTRFQAFVRLGAIAQRDVIVEVVGGDLHGGIWKKRLTLAKDCGSGSYLYEGTVHKELNEAMLASANVRVSPCCEDFAHPFEMELSAWG